MGVPKSKDDSEEHQVIYVVDDEPMLLELAEGVLNKLNCEIRTFSDPQKALKVYSEAQNPPDLLITDYAMHEMDGMNLIRECRKIHPKQKIILISGTVDESIYSGSGEKPNRFLAKPYQPLQLAGMVQEVLAS